MTIERGDGDRHPFASNDVTAKGLHTKKPQKRNANLKPNPNPKTQNQRETPARCSSQSD